MNHLPPTQYADDRNLRARQRLWDFQEPRFDLVGWTLDLACVTKGQRVLDVGCGNGAYWGALAAQGVALIGVDLSLGMLRSVAPRRLANADITRLPFPRVAFDVVLAPHMLYHVPDRRAAASEVRRVLRPGGVAVFVTNGATHIASLRALVERAVRRTDPEWEMANPSTHVFSLDNGAEQLSGSFDSVECVHADSVAPTVIRDATIVADYVASVEDHYATQIAQPWNEIVSAVRDDVAATINHEGSFTVQSVVGAFVCR